MSIQPFIKCSSIGESLAFYTEILDFTVNLPPSPIPDSFMSKYASLDRNGYKVHLSEHEGDGVFGNVVYIEVDNIDSLFEEFKSNGLNVSHPEKLPAIRLFPTEQTWGMKEFSVSDPDGNRIVFGQSIKPR